jgi:hypothetical protein
MTKTYKKIDSLERLLANFWNIFPNLTVAEFSDKVIQPYLLKSTEFCELLNNNIIYLPPTVARGGFGSVKPFKIYEDTSAPEDPEDIEAILVSRKQSGGFEPFYLPVIIKVSNVPKIINQNQFTAQLFNNTSAQNTNNPIILGLPDPISEIIFGAMVGFLYDSGICPGFLKYFGSYACPSATGTADEYNISIVSEKSTFSMNDILERANDRDLYVDDDTIINLLFQYVYTIYVGKKYLGLTHFDTHCGNVMVSYINRNTYDFRGYTTIPYIYRGMDMNKVRYILIKSPGEDNTYIAIKNNGLLLKLIDYGLVSTYLNRSSSDLVSKRIQVDGTLSDRISVTLSTDPALLQTIGSMIPQTNALLAFNKCMNSSSARNTIEIQYLLNNIYEYLYKGLDAIVGRNVPPNPVSNINYINNLKEFSGVFFDNDPNGPHNVEAYVNDPSPVNQFRKIQFIAGRGWDGMSRDRNVGHADLSPTFDNVDELIYGLKRYCTYKNHFDVVNGNTIYYLEPDIDVNLIDFNDRTNTTCLFLDSDNLLDNSSYKFIEKSYEYQLKCMLDTNATSKQKACSEIKKNDPNTTLEKPLLSRTKDLFNNRGKLSDNSLDPRNLDFRQFLRVQDSQNRLRVYSIQINPSGVISSKSDSDDFVYRTYQQWFDIKNIKNEKDGKYIQNVNVDVLYLDPRNMISKAVARYGYGTPNGIGGLWEYSEYDNDFKNANTSVVVNGGYFTVNANSVQENEADRILPGIINPNADYYRPIGFYYNINDIANSGTTIPVPKPYIDYFGFITCRGNRIAIEGYNDFYQNFLTIEEPILYKLDNGKYYTTTQPVIALRVDGSIIPKTFGGRPMLLNETLLPITGDDVLQYAFCSGPILVKNRNIVFDLNTMINKEFAVVDSDTPYFYPEGPIDPNIIQQDKPPNLTSYKIVFNAKDDYMFKASEGDMTQIYGMRHSARYMIHNVLGINDNGEILFIMVEGRGYDAPGLDRVQLANLVDKFNIVDAISLDGGFSANAVYKIDNPDNSDRKYLMNTPDKRGLGVMMSFNWI